MPVALSLRILVVGPMFGGADLKAYVAYLIHELCDTDHEVSIAKNDIYLSGAMSTGEFDLVIILADLESPPERQRCRQIVAWFKTVNKDTKTVVISRFFKGVGTAADEVGADKLLLDLPPFVDIQGAIVHLFQ